MSEESELRIVNEMLGIINARRVGPGRRCLRS